MIHLLILSILLATASSHPVLAVTGENPHAIWNGYDLSTNYYEQVPDTGVVREYFFDIVNTTAAPDGRDRGVLLVNGEFPGPTIIADWGDTVKVTVRNSMQNNGSSIHWHGVRQFYTPQMDGTPSITQCPIAPGQNYTYTWRADQYGSSWYHSHFSLQAWDGIFGGITINGPASADYDEDLGSLFLSDWSVESVDALYPDQLQAAYNAQFTNGLLNGTNVFDFGNGTIVGERLKTTLTPGKRYRLRLISATMHTMYKFSVDNHNLTVIANDFVPVQPFSTNHVSINSGQRYDVILEANQPADNYWMRAFPLDQCSNNTSPDNIRGIIHYDTASNDDPTTTKNEYGSESLCFDMNMDGFDLTPVVALDANITGATTVTTPVSTYTEGAPTEYFWEIGQLPFSTRWDDPTLLEATTVANANYTEAQNVIRTDTPYEWTILVMQTTVKLSHPIHLHGRSSDLAR